MRARASIVFGGLAVLSDRHDRAFTKA